jgi:hypothetical protein
MEEAQYALDEQGHPATNWLESSGAACDVACQSPNAAKERRHVSFRRRDVTSHSAIPDSDRSSRGRNAYLRSSSLIGLAEMSADKRSGHFPGVIKVGIS